MVSSDRRTAAGAEMVTGSRRDGGYELEIRRERGEVVIAVRGDIDVRRAGQIARLLDDVSEGQGNRSVAVDLSEVDAFDASLVDCLDRAARLAARRRRVVRVSSPGISADVLRAVAPGLLTA